MAENVYGSDISSGALIVLRTYVYNLLHRILWAVIYVYSMLLHRSLCENSVKDEMM